MKTDTHVTQFIISHHYISIGTHLVCIFIFPSSYATQSCY